MECEEQYAKKAQAIRTKMVEINKKLNEHGKRDNHGWADVATMNELLEQLDKLHKSIMYV